MKEFFSGFPQRKPTYADEMRLISQISAMSLMNENVCYFGSMAGRRDRSLTRTASPSPLFAACWAGVGRPLRRPFLVAPSSRRRFWAATAKDDAAGKIFAMVQMMCASAPAFRPAAFGGKGAIQPWRLQSRR
ncbi:hypothetical protein GMI69_04725 [Eggerthellaceae bacterium zg-887]|nr:hypothetical protein [Xiamenia xianingshaonis]